MVIFNVVLLALLPIQFQENIYSRTNLLLITWTKEGLVITASLIKHWTDIKISPVTKDIPKVNKIKG